MRFNFRDGQRLARSFAVQNVGVEIYFMRPNNSANLRVNAHPSKKRNVLKRSEDAASPFDTCTKIKFSGNTIGKYQPKAILFEASNMRYSRKHQFPFYPSAGIFYAG